MNKSPRESTATSERPTMELCANELQKGVHCILPRGHAGDHECHTTHDAHAITWKQRAS